MNPWIVGFSGTVASLLAVWAMLRLELPAWTDAPLLAFALCLNAGGWIAAVAVAA